MKDAYEGKLQWQGSGASRECCVLSVRCVLCQLVQAAAMFTVDTFAPSLQHASHYYLITNDYGDCGVEFVWLRDSECVKL